jgi:hypothetical protein
MSILPGWHSEPSPLAASEARASAAARPCAAGGAGLGDSDAFSLSVAPAAGSHRDGTPGPEDRRCRYAAACQ